MGRKVSMGLLLAFVVTCSQGGEIRRWVDDQGVVHFGDVPPAKAAAGNRAVEVRPMDTNNRRRLQQMSKAWVKKRFKKRKPVKGRKGKSSRGYSERLRYKNAMRGKKLLVGMTPAEVKSMLGRPSRTSGRSSGKGTRERWYYRWKNKPDQTVLFKNGEVSGWN